jgi:membrane protein YqaA with SNARE-associated domain
VSGFFSRIHAAALAAGGPGLFGAAFLDSSFVPLPEINDLLVVLMVRRHPLGLPYYALMAAAGSVAGCFVLYVLARRGGSAFLAKRMSLRRGDQVLGLYQRYGVLALMIPALLPPPAPFKMFVLLAGVAGVSPLQFGVGIGAARQIRFGALGWLAIRYGDAALELMRTRGPEVSLTIVGTIVAIVLVVWWRRRKPVD